MELQRRIGVTYKCAWRMTQVIKSMLGERRKRGDLDGSDDPIDMGAPDDASGLSDDKDTCIMCMTTTARVSGSFVRCATGSRVATVQARMPVGDLLCEYGISRCGG